VFENRVLRRIFLPKKDEDIGGCRKPHNEELHNFYSSSYKIGILKSRRMRGTGNVARIVEKRKACSDFSRKVRRKVTTRKT
jgi:hypothetical protein